MESPSFFHPTSASSTLAPTSSTPDCPVFRWRLDRAREVAEWTGGSDFVYKLEIETRVPRVTRGVNEVVDVKVGIVAQLIGFDVGDLPGDGGVGDRRETGLVIKVYLIARERAVSYGPVAQHPVH